MTVILFIGGIVFSIIGYFLRSTMTELKEVKSITVNTAQDLAVHKAQMKGEIDVIATRFESAIDRLGDKLQNMAETYRNG